MRVALIGAWGVALLLRVAVIDDASSADTIMDIAFWGLSLALIIPLLAPFVIRERTEDTLTAVMRYVLVPGWIVLYVYRVAGDNGDEPLSTVSFVAFWVVSVALIGCFVWRRRLLKREDSGPELPA